MWYYYTVMGLYSYYYYTVREMLGFCSVSYIYVINGKFSILHIGIVSKKTIPGKNCTLNFTY